MKLEIGDFLGYCDLNGVEAVTSEQAERLELYIRACHESASKGEPIVENAIYDRLMEILREVNPNSELCSYIWEDEGGELTDTDALFRVHPMYSIQTVKSWDCKEYRDFLKRLPSGVPISFHASFKENGHGIRLVYQDGEFIKARSRARASAGRDITKQLRVVLEKYGLLTIEGYGLTEIRGELVCALANKPAEAVSAFTAVSMLVKESGTEADWGKLDFLAYQYYQDGVSFQTKAEEYEFLEQIGFETPPAWDDNEWTKEELEAGALQQAFTDWEEALAGYPFYTDGVVLEVNDRGLFDQLGDDGASYRHGNVALKVGAWKQDLYHGVVQCILWTKGKTKLSPVAIVADEEDMAEFTDGVDKPYCFHESEISNLKGLGVIAANGAKVRRIPLYEPSNLLALDAYRGSTVYFRYGGEAGVVPCYSDGTPLIEGRIREEFYDF